MESTTLTILGRASEHVTVFYRDRSDPPPPPVWEGDLDESGSVTIEVPTAYLIVIGSSGSQAILRLHENRPETLTIELG